MVDALEIWLILERHLSLLRYRTLVPAEISTAIEGVSLASLE
jgi:hypothetical protein